MLSKDRFLTSLLEAYDHLYDMVYLRTSPLADVLIPDPSLPRKEKAWQLHRILLDTIEELDPGPQAPVFSQEWRRHRLMVLRYAEGLDPRAVARQLAISRRHYYRQLREAIGAIADILWDRYVASPSARPQASSQHVAEEPAHDQLELLRLEAARTAQVHRYVHVGEVVHGTVSLLQKMLQQHGLSIHLALPEALPSISFDKGLLRHMLLGMLGSLAEHADQAQLRITARGEDSGVYLSLVIEPPTAVRAATQDELQEQVSAFAEMAALSGARILPIRTGQAVTGFEVHLPSSPQRTVLVVDDNEDVLELFQRYLAPHRYRVATAQNAREALLLARQLQPYAITLDLMMPDQDGWDLLQTLLNRPDTRHIPVIVCSVLRQKELALSLGAAAFLPKPVSEQALLAALAALEEGQQVEA
jgi:CheY-like chemotaxis protein